MAKYVDPTKLDYRYGGDKLSNFALKYMETMNYVFKALNELKSPGTVSEIGSEPYQFKVEDDHLFIRNGENTDWIKLMDVSLYGGFKNETFGKLQCGDYVDRPSVGNKNYDTYWCTDGCVYQWLNDRWNIILSKNVKDLDGYEHLILDEHTAEEGGVPHKILWTNSLGQLEADITGSPGKIAGKTVYAPTIKDNQVLKFNYERDRWEVDMRDVITWENTSTIGEEDKLVKADQYGRIHIDTTGNAGKIAHASIDANVLQDGDVLVFRALTGTFINKPGAVVDENGVVQANVSGSAAKWNGKPLKTVALQDGQILVWSETDQAFINRNQGTIGSGRALVISQDGVEIANYNGDVYTNLNLVTPHHRVPSMQYKVGDVCFSKALPYTTYLECTTPGTTAITEPDYSDVRVGGTVTDGSVVWKVRGFVTTDGSDNGSVSISITGNAATADKLKTARTINGTSFDGSANIITNNWGTARNITIKDADSTNAGTAVSVNGGANVVLLLPSAIKANITGTVNGHSVNADVPSGAKFTDTTYTALTASEATTGTATTARTITAKVLADYVAAKVAALVNSAPASLDTLKELADALGSDPNFATTITNALAGKLDATATAVNAAKVNGLTVQTAVPANAKFTDTTYSTFVKSGSTAAAGLVPKPSTTAGTTKYLREDGTWQVPPDNNTTYTAASAAPLVAGTATVGTSAKYAREDHVHPAQTSVSGNAGTATKLATGRTINGTSFDGSANIITNNWGTARNITIKDASSTNAGTAVSVNGSVAVTLLLPGTIKANLTGNADTATKINGKTIAVVSSFDSSTGVLALVSG